MPLLNSFKECITEENKYLENMLAYTKCFVSIDKNKILLNNDNN